METNVSNARHTLSIKDKVAGIVQIALKEVFNKNIDASRIVLQSTRPEFEGTYTFVIFPFVKELGGNPVEIGNKIGDYLVEKSREISGYNVVKGFLNLVISEVQWMERFDEIVSDPDFETGTPTGKTIMVEFASPNTNKPLHLGHLRNIFLGDSISSILIKAGNEVVRTQIINDRGIHICKSMLAWKRYGNGATPTDSLKGDKLVGNYYVRFDQEYKKEIKEIVAAALADRSLGDIPALRKRLQEEKKNDSISVEDLSLLNLLDEQYAIAEKQAPILLEAQMMLKKWEEGDEEVNALWRKMNGWVYDGFDVTYKTLGVGFDKLYYESNTYLTGRDEVLKGLKEGVFYQKEDQSVWVDLESDKLDHKLLLRSDGTSVYMTQDIGTAILRFKDYPKLSGQVYTVGNEQEYHFKVLFSILKKLGFSWAEACYHLSYGMVDLPSGKMKSREGTVVDADDLVAEMVDTARRRTRELGKIDGFTTEEAEDLYHKLALGALKYFLLKVDPVRRMLFNPEESIEFQGNTGPFIQYTYARISSLLRKAVEENIPTNDHKSWTELLTEADYHLDETESEVIGLMSKFPEIVQEAANSYQPSIIANYLYDVAKSFNRFYSTQEVMKEPDSEIRAFRIEFCKQVALVIEKAMNMLGIEVPERM